MRHGWRGLLRAACCVLAAEIMAVAAAAALRDLAPEIWRAMMP